MDLARLLIQAVAHRRSKLQAVCSSTRMSTSDVHAVCRGALCSRLGTILLGGQRVHEVLPGCWSRNRLHPRQTIVCSTCHSNHQAMPCKLAPAKAARMRTSESGRNATTCGANCSRFCDSTSARLRSLRLAHCRLEEDAHNPASLQSQGRKHNTSRCHARGSCAENMNCTSAVWQHSSALLGCAPDGGWHAPRQSGHL